MRKLLIAAAVDSAGTGLFLSASAVFFTRYWHLAVGQVGLGLSAGALAGLAGTLPIGYLADRYSPRNVLIGLCLWRAACFTGYAFAGSFPSFIAIALCQGAAERGAAPVRQAIVAHTVDDDHKVAAAALLRTAQNASFAAGAAVATAALATASHAAFIGMTLGNAGSFVMAAVAVLGIPASAGAHLAGARAPAWRRASPWRALGALTGGLRDRRFFAFCGLNGLLALHNSLLLVGLPLWIVARRTVTVAVVPGLTLLNTVLVVLLQVVVASAAKTVHDSARCLMRAGVALAAACAIVGFTARTANAPITLILLSVAVLGQTVAELYRSAGGWGISLSYAQGDRTSRYLAVFSLGTAAEAIAGPVLFADAVIPSGAVGWWVIGAVFCLTGMVAWRLAARGTSGVVLAAPERE